MLDTKIIANELGLILAFEFKILKRSNNSIHKICFNIGI